MATCAIRPPPSPSSSLSEGEIRSTDGQNGSQASAENDTHHKSLPAQENVVLDEPPVSTKSNDRRKSSRAKLVSICEGASCNNTIITSDFSQFRAEIVRLALSVAAPDDDCVVPSMKLPSIKRKYIMEQHLAGDGIGKYWRAALLQGEKCALPLFSRAFTRKLLYLWERVLVKKCTGLPGLEHTLSPRPFVDVEAKTRIRNVMRCLATIAHLSAADKRILNEHAIRQEIPSTEISERFPKCLRSVLRSLWTYEHLAREDSESLGKGHTEPELRVQTAPPPSVSQKEACYNPRGVDVLPSKPKARHSSDSQLHRKKRSASPVQCKPRQVSSKTGGEDNPIVVESSEDDPISSRTRSSRSLIDSDIETRKTAEGRNRPFASDGDVNFSISTQHFILKTIQQVLERCAFDFLSKHRPEVLIEFGWIHADALELNVCMRYLRLHSLNLFGSTSDYSLWPDIAKAAANIRHAAVHRINVPNSQLIPLIGAAVRLTEDCFKDRKALRLLSKIQLMVIGKDEELVDSLGALTRLLIADENRVRDNAKKEQKSGKEDDVLRNLTSMAAQNSEHADDLQLMVSFELLEMVKALVNHPELIDDLY